MYSDFLRKFCTRIFPPLQMIPAEIKTGNITLNTRKIQRRAETGGERILATVQELPPSSEWEPVQAEITGSVAAIGQQHASHDGRRDLR